MSPTLPDPSPVLHRDYEGDLTTLRLARQDVVEWLTSHNANGETRDRAALIVSELTSNAIQAAPPGSTYSLSVCRLDDGCATISVRNRTGGSVPPARAQWRPANERPLSELSLRGRGLAIVDSLSEEVTVEHDDGAVVVTARLRIDSTST